jgi:GT2 family glycosyltransferase
MSIAIVVLTHDRVELLRRCVENVLVRASDATREIVVWNNASTDGTAAYLASLRDSRIKVVDHDRNIGQNGYAEAFKLTSQPYLVEVDDDVVDAPDGWDRILLDAFRRLPEIGFLAADLEDHPDDRATHDRYCVHEYREYELNGYRLLDGPTGGWCAITSRELYDRVGGMPQQTRRSYFLEDAAYIDRIRKHGYGRAILHDLHVVHAGDRDVSEGTAGKVAFFARERRAQRRKDAVKRALVTLPYVRTANAKYGWFVEPGS